MGQMAIGGGAMQNLQQEELHGGDRREHAVASHRVTHLSACGKYRVGPREPMKKVTSSA
jgi:hypothetical protein